MEQIKEIVIDSLSFCSMYIEIFNRKIFVFHSQNNNSYIKDCGSNIGISILFFKKIYTEAEIVTFEPVFVVLETLRDNVVAKKLANINFINKAVWKEDGEIHFKSKGVIRVKLFSIIKINKRYLKFNVKAKVNTSI